MSSPPPDEDTVAQEQLPERPAPGDSATFRVAAYGAVLVVVLFAGYGFGRLRGGGVASVPALPVSATADAAPGEAMGGDSTAAGMVMDQSQPHVDNGDGTMIQVGGLSLSAGGMTLAPLSTGFTAGRTQKLAFRILGSGGAAVTGFAMEHDKLLHLVIVRRDLSYYQHLHPAMAADGTWSIDVTLPAPGSYRMITDFTAVVGGKPLATTLGSDLTVAGVYQPVPLPAPVHAVAVDGFAVGYEGTPVTGSIQPIMMSVAGPDRQPAVLQPYLGAYGHLVMLREGDVAYLHIHPMTQLVDGKVKFWLAAPSPGTFRMFFDFQVAGKVHTAAWTVVVT